MAVKKAQYSWEPKAFELVTQIENPYDEDLEIIGYVVANHENGEAAVIVSDTQSVNRGIGKADFWSDALYDAEKIYKASCATIFEDPKA